MESIMYAITYRKKEFHNKDEEFMRNGIYEKNRIIGIKLIESLVNTEIVNTEISKSSYNYKKEFQVRKISYVFFLCNSN